HGLDRPRTARARARAMRAAVCDRPMPVPPQSPTFSPAPAHRAHTPDGGPPPERSRRSDHRPAAPRAGRRRFMYTPRRLGYGRPRREHRGGRVRGDHKVPAPSDDLQPLRALLDEVRSYALDHQTQLYGDTTRAQARIQG